MSTVVFDIGGTNTRIASVAHGKLHQIKKIKTDQDPHQGIQNITDTVTALVGGDISLFSGCSAGRVDESGVISDNRNLLQWEGINIIQELTDALHVPVSIINDGAGVGLGEAVYGAGKGFDTVAYVTVSTGVGGARIQNQRIDFEKSTLAIGRIVVGNEDLESLISGTAVQKKYGVHPKDLDDIVIRNDLARTLAEGLLMVINEWKPDVIVLGGSMIVGKNPIPLNTVESELETICTDSSVKKPVIKKAELGDNGGLWGSLAYALQQKEV